MKTIVFSRILIIFTTLVVTGSLFAQASSDLDSYSERLRLENELKQNIESIVSTQLDRDTFEIGVSLSIEKVSKAPEAIRKTEDNSDFYPSDLNLGILDIGKVIDSYEDELEKERKKQEEQQGPEYQIKSLDVLVGLHQKYGEEYFKAFEVFDSFVEIFLLKTLRTIEYATIEILSSGFFLLRFFFIPENFDLFLFSTILATSSTLIILNNHNDKNGKRTKTS